MNSNKHLNISERYNNAIKRAQFDFDGINRYFALFTNPYFFVRFNLFFNIKAVAPIMKGKMLDFGCGAKPYKSLFYNSTEYIGLDIDQGGHDHTDEDIDVFYDGVHIPFKNNEFDCIFSSEVFEHAEELNSIINQLYDCLKNEGYMLLTIPFVWPEHEKPFDFRRYTVYGIKKLLKQAGFEIVYVKKSTSFVEMVFQLLMEYIRVEYKEKIPQRMLRILFHRIIVVPIVLLGCVTSVVLPQNWDLYGDTIVLCRKLSKDS